MTNNVIRALYDDHSIIVYQAYNNAIAVPALKSQSLNIAHFKTNRMTWIKPSFLWMMYRSGWASKEDQNNILAIRIKRDGFEWALQHSCLSRFDASVYDSPNSWKQQIKTTSVRIQWDPERDLFLQPLTFRTIQIGLSKEAVERYLHEWIIQIENVTDKCNQISNLVHRGKIEEAVSLLPPERVYPLPRSLKQKVKSS